MGLSKPVGKDRVIVAEWKNDNTLELVENYQIKGSQGLTPVTCFHTYEYSPESDILTYTIKRSTRKTGNPVKYVF